MKSPFFYEKFATGEYFFGREDELNKISSIAKTSNNILIYSLRRFGKSSLIKEYMRRDKESLSIYADIYNITTEKDFINVLLKSIAQVQKGTITQTVKQLSKIFTRASFEIVFDATTGKSKISPRLNDTNFDDAIDDMFQALFAMSKKQKIILAIDEFQQVNLIKNVRIDAVMRKYMQEDMDISYIFLGSKRHTLTELFKYKAPLYEMATHLEIGAIKDEDYIAYIQKHLKISDELILYILNIAKYETKLIQHICHILYTSHKKRVITKEDVSTTIQEIVFSKDTSYSMVYDGFSLNKKKAFKIICNYTDFYKQEVLNKFSISKQALLSSFNSLLKDELIDKNENGWFVPDRTFELWGKIKF